MDGLLDRFHHHPHRRGRSPDRLVRFLRPQIRHMDPRRESRNGFEPLEPVHLGIPWQARPDLRRAHGAFRRSSQDPGGRSQEVHPGIPDAFLPGSHRPPHQRGVHPQPLSRVGVLGFDRWPAGIKHRRCPRVAQACRPY